MPCAARFVTVVQISVCRLCLSDKANAVRQLSLLPCAARFGSTVQISVYRSKKELSLRASAHTGVAIPQSFRDPYIGRKSEIIRNSVGLRQNTALRRRRGSPHQSEDWFAMTSYFLCAVTDQQHAKLQLSRDCAKKGAVAKGKIATALNLTLKVA